MSETPDARSVGEDLDFGRMALEQGFVTQEQIREALSEQAREAAGGRSPARLLGTILVDRGYLTEQQLRFLSRAHPPKAGPEAKKSPSFPPFGKYTLLREIGRGGMGVVYEALDTTLNRKVALKLLLTSPNADSKESALEEERFVREARLTASLPPHPHIVQVLEAGVIDRKRYIAMEIIPGRQMKDWRKSGSVTIRQQVTLLRDLAFAVDHAHQAGIIHRDLKPANVIVDDRNEPHVTDFGLAKQTGQDATLSLTASGMVIGTPLYMSPEQAQARRDIDKRTDIWSMGVMLYEILTGTLPFNGDSPLAILMKVVKDSVALPSHLVKGAASPAVDKAVETICLKALAKKPKHRYQTSREFALDLTRWLKGELAHEAPRIHRKIRRQAEPPSAPWGWIASGVAAAVVIVLIVAGSSSAPEPPPEKSRTTAGPTAPKNAAPVSISTAPSKPAAGPVRPPPKPDAAILDSVAKAREFEQTNPTDYAGIRQAWVGAELDAAGTSRYDEVHANVLRIDKARQEFIARESAKVGEQVKSRVKESKFGEAIALLAESRPKHPDLGWTAALAAIEEEARKSASDRYVRMMEEAGGDPPKVRQVLVAVKTWGLPEFEANAEDYLAQLESAKKPGNAPAPTPPPILSPGKSPDKSGASKPAGAVQKGTILREYWTGVVGSAVTDLTNHPAYPNSPSGTEFVGTFEGPTDWGDNYGTRFRGFLHPPKDGPYIFWIASDDGSELFVSTDEAPANKRPLAAQTMACRPRDWNAYPTQKSEPVYLLASKRYYVEAVHKEGGGGDHISVGWKLPDGTEEKPIPGSRLSPFLNAKSPKTPVPGSGLVAHWKLDESSGTTVADISGRGHGGRLAGQPAWTAGKVGGALGFNGKDSQVTVDDAADLQIPGDLTIAFWVRKQAPGGDWQRIVGKGDERQRNYGVWTGGEQGGDKVMFQQFNRDGQSVLSFLTQRNLEPGKWHHVACVLEGERGLIYLDGAKDAETRRTGAPAISNVPFVMGFGTHSHFAGTMDDVRIYNRALGGPEILALTTQQEPAAPGGPAAAAKDPRPAGPDSSKVTEAERAIRARPEYKKPTALFARKVYEEALQSSNDPVLQLALLKEARKLAAETGDAAIAVKAIDLLAVQTSGDPVEMKLDTLGIMARSPKLAPADFTAVLEACLAVVDECVTADRYELTKKLVDSAELAARGSQLAWLSPRLRFKAEEVTYIQGEYNKVKSNKNSSAYGKFLCFVKNNWAQGLSLLANSSEPEFGPAAEKELAPPATPDDQIALGKKWWELGEKEKSSPNKRRKILAHAREWYERAWKSQTGTAKLDTEATLRKLWGAENGKELGTESQLTDWIVAWNKATFTNDKDSFAGDLSLKIDAPPNAPGDYAVLFPQSKHLGIAMPKAELVFWFKEVNPNNADYSFRMNPEITLYENDNAFIKLTPKGNKITRAGPKPGLEGWRRLAVPLYGSEEWTATFSKGELKQINWFTIGIGSYQNSNGYTVWIDGLMFR